MNKRPKVSVNNGVAIIDDHPISLQNITIDNPIDSGAHGTVFEGTETELGRKVAVKVWYRAGETVREGAIGEVRKLAALTHPLFVTVYQLTVSDAAPYSIMEFLPGPSLKKWLRANEFRQMSEIDLIDHLRENKKNIRQRCKFWFLYSAGLKYLYSLDLLHGDPHLGNVIVFEDSVGTSNHLISHHALKVSDLASIRMLDLGTSLFREDPTQIRVRESKVIFESAEKLFPDFNPRRVMSVDLELDPSVMLRVLDQYVEYVLELSSIPGMTKTDFDFLSHSLPQLLGWCPFFDYKVVSEHLKSLFQPHDARGLITDTLMQMQDRNAVSSPEDDMQLIRQPEPTIVHIVGKLTELSKQFRTLHWKLEPNNGG